MIKRIKSNFHEIRRRLSMCHKILKPSTKRSIVIYEELDEFNYFDLMYSVHNFKIDHALDCIDFVAVDLEDRFTAEAAGDMYIDFTNNLN